MTETAVPDPSRYPVPPAPPLGRRPLFRVIFPLLIVGWIVAAIRLALDAYAPDAAYWFGVYWVMPIALFWLGMRGAFDDVSWPRFALAMLLTAILVWGVPNFISYGIAQFAGWKHGRFAPNIRSAPIAETTGAKVVTAAMLAGGTTLAGTIWMIALGTLLGWLPGYVHRRRGVAPPR